MTGVTDFFNGPVIKYRCDVVDNRNVVRDPRGVSDHAALMLVSLQDSKGRWIFGSDRPRLGWIYGPVRPWWVQAYRADFYRRTPDLAGFLALARDVVTYCGGYCDVY